jgi:hypothetical protein
MAIYLHYIGKQMYEKDEYFIREGKRLNVQRLTSYNMVRKLIKSMATIYYARYEQRGYARVFAKGKVIGYATSHPYLKEKIINEGYGRWSLEVRGCGSCYTATYFSNSHEEMIQDLENMKYNANRYRWFILTDIEPYNTAIDNKITYNVRKRQIIVQDIEFTRGFICLNGIDEKTEINRFECKAVKMHRLKNRNEYDDIKPRIDLSGYTQLDNWLGGGGILC